MNVVRNESIMIIDDEEVILDLTSIILKNRGYNVLIAPNAVEGLNKIEQFRPEVVLLDYMMPGIDGLTALKEIKARFADTYVIMFTGKGSEEIAVELMKAGASDYILKPFNNQNLIDRLENVLKIRDVELKNLELTQERERLLKEIEEWNRELERRVREKSEALERAQAEIIQTEKLAALGHLSTGMAHEIRNPLNSIALVAQLLKGGSEGAEKLEYTEKILAEVDRVDGILRKLLDVSKRPRFETKPILLGELLDGALEFYRPQIEMQKIQVVKELINPPPPIMADPAELEQIFTNLIANSIHEMRDGGSLTIMLDHNEADITLRIADTGGGIPRENLSRIFDPFFTTKANGTGLGLSLVFRIVKNYNGSIEIEKSDATGTTFCVRLPLKNA